MVYLIHCEDVCPDSLRSNDRRERLTLSHTPGETNLSHEARTEGWLGTTGDVAAHALGEFEDGDLDGIVEAIEAQRFVADRDELAAWLAGDGADDLDITQMDDDVIAGESYRMVVNYDAEGNHSIEEIAIRDGYVMLDQYWDGYGNECSTYERERWTAALDAAGIWHEDDDYESMGSSGYYGLWFVTCRAEDEERARQLAAWECSECGEHFHPANDHDTLCRDCQELVADDMAEDLEPYGPYVAEHVRQALAGLWKSGAPYAGPWRTVGDTFECQGHRLPLGESYIRRTDGTVKAAPTAAHLDRVRQLVAELPVEVTLRECTGDAMGHSPLAIYVTHDDEPVYRVDIRNIASETWRAAVQSRRELAEAIAQAAAAAAERERRIEALAAQLDSLRQGAEADARHLADLRGRLAETDAAIAAGERQAQEQ